MSYDYFAGRIDQRLDRAERLVRRMALDAQCRDWAAERPDRLGFARLAQAHLKVRTALLRFTHFDTVTDWLPGLLNLGACAATAVLVLLLVPDPAAPVTLAGALASGLVTGQAAMSLLMVVRGRRARRAAETGPAPIDDPYRYAELTQRIEACAATIRSDYPLLQDAADDLDHALYWASAAQR